MLTDAKNIQEAHDWKDTVDDLVLKATSFKIEKSEQMEEAADILSMIKDAGKELEKARKEAVRPLNDEVKLINDSYKPLTQSLADSEKAVKSKILDFQREQERIAREARERLEEQRRKEAEANTPPEPMLIEPEIPQPVTKSATGSFGKVSTKKVWKFRLTDFAAVPDEFKILDEVAVRKAMNADSSQLIPGIEFYQEEVIASR